MTALVLPAASRRLRTRAPATLAVLGVLAWGFRYAPADLKTVVVRGPENLATLWRFDEVRSEVRAFDAKLKAERALPASFLDRIGDATVDVYPWETSYVWANDLNWSPRPVFQAYAAYTPALDMMGARHYRGRRAPRFVIYSHITIDYEHPCAVDSRTWIELYRWYDLVDRHGDMLLLERRVTPRWNGAAPIDRAEVALGRGRYEIPREGGGLVFLKADLELSTLGKLQAMVYRVDPPVMRVKYADGAAAQYRMVWRNTAEGFLVGRLPRDLDAAAKLFQGGAADEVVAISFHDPHGWFRRTARVQALRSRPAAALASTTDAAATH